MSLIKYKDNTLDLVSGDVILYRNNFRLFEPVTWLSAAIRAFDGSKYNHGGIVISNWGKLFINEALGKGVVARPIEEVIDRKRSRIIVLTPIVPVADEEAFCLRANSMLGKKYDYKHTLVDQAWYRLRKKFAPNKNLKYSGHTANFADSRFACTEYAAWCHEIEGWEHFSPWEFMNVTTMHPDRVYTLKEKKEKLFFQIKWQEPL